MEVLDARERRAAAQTRLRQTHGLPLISFTMNIPGPIKNSSLIRRTFALGRRALSETLDRAGLVAAAREELDAVTGCELLWAVNAPASRLKELCLAIEESAPVGRLFDMDVIGADGVKLDRASPRTCLICGQAGRGCASRRVHSAAELQAAARKLMADHFLAADRRRLETLATAALTEEVRTTPKPGLVDRNNTGSHRDMTVETFLRSAGALESYWGECFLLGHADADAPPESCFARLREAGLRAEARMYAATGGVNTHKGVIFTLGTVCGAIGRLWTAGEPCRDAEAILSGSAELCRRAVEEDLAAIRGREALTGGERLYLRYGLTGARGELAAGLPGVAQTALPVFEGALERGRDRNEAGVLALLHLIARGTDSNMAARGGPEKAAAAARETAELLARGEAAALAEAEALDRRFIRDDLSPGGCADLLAICYFLHDWKSGE